LVSANGTHSLRNRGKPHLHGARMSTKIDGAAAIDNGATGKRPVRSRLTRQDTLRFAAVSAALLIPLCWHRRIEAGDLASHLYNALLAQLIHQGRAPGLWIARQWNNVLFDRLLSVLGSAFGLRIAEKIAVSLAVLIFFWGAFALISVSARRAAWRLAPLIAVFAYGWTFEMGFMNYYISLGLCFFALAALWRFKRGGRLIVVALIPLMWIAHPLGVVCFAAVAGYTAAAKTLRPRRHIYLFLASGIFLLGVRLFLARHYEVRWNGLARYFFFNGADQLALYGPRYYLLYALFAALFFGAVAVEAANRWRQGDFWNDCGIPVQLYLAAGVASVLLPSVITFPQYTQPISFLSSRLSSVSAILACCLLGGVQPRRWHAIGCTLIAVLFFAFLYSDTGAVNRMEEQVEGLVAALPPGHRVVEDISLSKGSRVTIEHIVDRACIDRCFSFENYEPSTGQFRIRAAVGNSIVDASAEQDDDVEATDEAVRALDPPVFDIDRCSASSDNFCVRELSADEINDLIEGTWDDLSAYPSGSGTPTR
jgi:hypothetical protein